MPNTALTSLRERLAKMHAECARLQDAAMSTVAGVQQALEKRETGPAFTLAELSVSQLRRLRRLTVDAEKLERALAASEGESDG